MDRLERLPLVVERVEIHAVVRDAPTLLKLNEAIQRVGGCLADALADVEREPGVPWCVAISRASLRCEARSAAMVVGSGTSSCVRSTRDCLNAPVAAATSRLESRPLAAR